MMQGAVKVFTLRVRPKWRKRVAEEAKRRGLSSTMLVVHLVDKALAANDPPVKPRRRASAGSAKQG